MKAAHSDFNLRTDGHDEWLTPPEIIEALGIFDLDPCSPGERRPWDTAKLHYGLPQDGLTLPWKGRVWLNPPYGRETFKWISKLADHGNGIALTFARTDTNGFHDQVFEKADAILFMRGRVNFYTVEGKRSDRANAPSCLIAFGENNVKALIDSGIKGKVYRNGKD